MNPDVINAIFELSGGAFVALNIRRALLDKEVKGVSPVAVLCFTVWGIWNLYYYPTLDQWASFVGGVFVFIANIIWLLLIIRYWRTNANL